MLLTDYSVRYSYGLRSAQFQRHNDKSIYVVLSEKVTTTTPKLYDIIPLHSSKNGTCRNSNVTMLLLRSTLLDIWKSSH